MRQLQLFTSVELAAMRDRSRSRNYSPAGDEFRRVHERHREWGLRRRHAERLRRLPDDSFYRRGLIAPCPATRAEEGAAGPIPVADRTPPTPVAVRTQQAPVTPGRPASKVPATQSPVTGPRMMSERKPATHASVSAPVQVPGSAPVQAAASMPVQVPGSAPVAQVAVSAAAESPGSGRSKDRAASVRTGR